MFTIKQQQIFKFLILCLLSFIGLFVYFDNGGTVLKAVVVFLVFDIITKIANFAYHRWLAHKLVSPSRPVGIFMLWCVVCTALVKPVEYVAGHRLHHKHPDSDQDPHNPKLGFWNCLIGNFNVPENIRVPLSDVFKNKDVMFVQKHFYLLWFANLAVFYLIDTDLFFLSFSLLNLRYLIAVTSFNYWSHGGKNGSGPVNFSVWMSLLMGGAGEGLHKNHHDRPYDLNYGSDSKFNKDYVYLIYTKLFENKNNEYI